MTKKEWIDILNKYAKEDDIEIEMLIEGNKNREEIYLFSIETELENEGRIIFNFDKQ